MGVPSGTGHEEAQQRVLCPVAVVAGGVVGSGKVGAVASMLSLDEGNVRVGGD